MSWVDHGTRLVTLKPAAILAAAAADIQRYRRNCLQLPEFGPCGCETYAFHRLHVRKAMKREFAGPKEIIALALNDLERGRNSGKRQTRELYADEALLRSVLDVNQGGTDVELSPSEDQIGAR